ncbi:hypothetical protein D3C78_1751900 [compost metagenome]
MRFLKGRIIKAGRGGQFLTTQGGHSHISCMLQAGSGEDALCCQCGAVGAKEMHHNRLAALTGQGQHLLAHGF